MATIIAGRIMGKRRKEWKNCAALNFCLDKVRAAGIPNKEARILVIVAILMLLKVAITHSFVPKKFLYHWKDNPLGGNSRYLEELKEMGKTMKRGRTRNKKISPQKI
jgi:hypothetical protein